MAKNSGTCAAGSVQSTVRLSTLLSLTVLLSACDGRTPVSPSPPPAGVTTPSSATYTLSGVVTEMTATGPAPIEGARVVDASGRSAATDGDGAYLISGLPASSRTISVTRNGYLTGTRTIAMTGDTELDIRLERIETYVLSGVVFEITDAGRVPLEGVELYCDSCGSADGHTYVHTNADDFYSLEWTANGVHRLFVSKAGYQIFDPTGTLLDAIGRIGATVRGDTAFDVQLVRR
jgi:hypothetical protein